MSWKKKMNILWYVGLAVTLASLFVPGPIGWIVWVAGVVAMFAAVGL